MDLEPGDFIGIRMGGNWYQGIYLKRSERSDRVAVFVFLDDHQNLAFVRANAIKKIDGVMKFDDLPILRKGYRRDLDLYPPGLRAMIVNINEGNF